MIRTLKKKEEEKEKKLGAHQFGVAAVSHKRCNGNEAMTEQYTILHPSLEDLWGGLQKARAKIDIHPSFLFFFLAERCGIRMDRRRGSSSLAQNAHKSG